MIHQIFGSAVPNIWVTAAITLGLLIFLTYLIRVPHDYPLRGMVVAMSALGFLGSATVLGLQIWHRSKPVVPAIRAGVDTAMKSLAQHEVDNQPVETPDAYVPVMPGTDSAVHERPSLWHETTNESIAQVVKFYADDANHPGWQVEFSAPNGMVLRRTVTALGQLENERLRIQAMRNPDRQGKHTQIEFELTRRLK